MTTFDFKQVKDFATGVNAQLDKCENDEGMQCHTLDASLSFCADCCCKFANELRQWGRDVFAGKVAFDQAAEQLWKAELLQIFQRARRLLALGRQAETECFILDGNKKLRAALWNLNQLMTEWVTPKLAVGPSARQELFVDEIPMEEVRQRIASLPALPSDWKPADPRQATRFQQIRRT